MLTVLGILGGFLLGLAFAAYNWVILSKIRKGLADTAADLKKIEAQNMISVQTLVGAPTEATVQISSECPATLDDVLQAIVSLSDRLRPSDGTAEGEIAKIINTIAMTGAENTQAIDHINGSLRGVLDRLDRAEHDLRGAETDLMDAIDGLRSRINGMTEVADDSLSTRITALETKLGQAATRQILSNVVAKVDAVVKQLGGGIDALTERVAKIERAQ